MKRLTCILLMLALAVSAVSVIGAVGASKSVGGLITSDTTWSLSDSPIQLNGPVGVASGATLTIQPGVTVDLGDYYIQVNGTLSALGTSDSKITFTTNGVEPKNSLATLQRIEFTYLALCGVSR